MLNLTELNCTEFYNAVPGYMSWNNSSELLLLSRKPNRVFDEKNFWKPGCSLDEFWKRIIASDVAIKYPDWQITENSICNSGVIFESGIWVKWCWKDGETGIAIPDSTKLNFRFVFLPPASIWSVIFFFMLWSFFNHDPKTLSKSYYSTLYDNKKSIEPVLMNISPYSSGCQFQKKRELIVLVYSLRGKK